MKDDWSTARRCVASHPLHGAHLQDKYVEVCLHSWCNAGTSSHSTYCCVFGITTSISSHLNCSCLAKRGVTWTQFPAALYRIWWKFPLYQNYSGVIYGVVAILSILTAWLVKSEVAENRVWHKTICFVLRKVDVVGVASWEASFPYDYFYRVTQITRLWDCFERCETHISLRLRPVILQCSNVYTVLYL